MVGVAPSPRLFAATAAYLASRAALNHYGEVARSNHRIGVYTLAQLSSPVLGSGLSILAAIALKADAATALAAMAVGQTVGIVATSVGLRRPLRLGRFDAAIFREARQFALPLIFSGLFAWVASNGVRVLVGAGEGVAGVGLFSVGWGLGQRLAAMLASLCAVASFPLAVDRLEAGDRDGALRQVSLNGALMFGLMAPAAVGVALLAGPFVRLAVAQQFQAATIAILPLAVFAGAARALRVHTGDQTALLVRRTRLDDGFQSPRRGRGARRRRCRRTFRRRRRRGGRLSGGNPGRLDGGDGLRRRALGLAPSPRRSGGHLRRLGDHGRGAAPRPGADRRLGPGGADRRRRV